MAPRSLNGRARADLSPGEATPESPRERRQQGKALPHLLGGIHALIYLSWTAAALHLFQRSGSLHGPYAAVTGWPWTLVLARLGVPMIGPVMAVAWLLNAGLFYRYGMLSARWLRSISMRK